MHHRHTANHFQVSDWPWLFLASLAFLVLSSILLPKPLCTFLYFSVLFQVFTMIIPTHETNFGEQLIVLQRVLPDSSIQMHFFIIVSRPSCTKPSDLAVILFLPFAEQPFPETPPSSALSSGWHLVQHSQNWPWLVPGLSLHSPCREPREGGRWLEAVQSMRQRAAERRWLTCPVSPPHALWAFGIAAPPVWSSSGSPAHTSSGPPHSGERKCRECQVSAVTEEIQRQCRSSTDLLEALQDSLHVLIPPEKVGKGALHRVEVGNRLISLSRQLPDWLTAGEAFLLLLILCRKHRKYIKISI